MRAMQSTLKIFKCDSQILNANSVNYHAFIFIILCIVQ